MIEQLETNYGTMFVPDTDNGQYWWLKTMNASPEDELIELICNLLDDQPKGIAIDCGANFGCWSLPLARHADVVYAFEPQRCVYNVLARTIRANPRLPIDAYQLALGPKDGHIQVPDVNLDDSTNFGGISLGIPHPEHPDAPMYNVSVITLDGFTQFNDDPVTFIKIDCEGAELGILQGAVRTIKRWKPIMIVEADHPLTDTIELGRFIEALGYNVEIAFDNNFIAMPV